MLYFIAFFKQNMKRILLIALLCIGATGFLYTSLGYFNGPYNNILTAQNIKNTDKYGIDVSHHQKQINWKEVSKEPIEFVYIKATEGATYVDTMFHKNATDAKKAGLLIGAYHFFRMTSSVENQFKNFKSAMSKHQMDLIPMIDVETDDGKPRKEVQKALEKFIQLIKAEYGVSPMIYGTQRSYNTFCAPDFNKYHLYIGRYSTKHPEIKGKGTYTIWQYTETGRIKGINKNVDKCRFNPKYSIKDILLPKKSQ